jgi:probable phosphoglycerate mutase
VDTRIQGQLDVPLNDTGRWQAERLARALAAREAINVIYTSDLLRAWETARAVSRIHRRAAGHRRRLA